MSEIHPYFTVFLRKSDVLVGSFIGVQSSASETVLQSIGSARLFSPIGYFSRAFEAAVVQSLDHRLIQFRVPLSQLALPAVDFDAQFGSGELGQAT